MYRLYVDEVGTDDVTKIEADEDRYLSLTGLAMEITHARDSLTPKLEWIKANVFNHDPDEPLILHRRKIVQRKQAFGVLNRPEKKAIFDRAIMRVFNQSEYKLITAFIDKQAMLKQAKWRNKHPYHFLMEVLVEKYAQFLERKDAIGDVMPEGRKGPKDAKLQEIYDAIRRDGTYYVNKDRICSRIPATKLKFRYKPDNIAGLQLCDLLAHPSHMTIREKLKHPVALGDFCSSIKAILMQEKYDRSTSGTIVGYGMKWL